MRVLYISIITIVFLAFSGCSIKPEVTKISTYSLKNEVKQPKIESKICTDKTLKILYPRGFVGVEDKKIYYSKPNYELQPYLKSYWTETPSIALKRVFYLDAHSSNIFSLVTQDSGFLKVDFMLGSDIFTFEQKFDEDENSYVEVGATFTLLDAKSREIIAVKKFLVQKTPPSNDAKGAVFAFNEAASVLSCNLIDWLREIICK